jgi:hypothetical protein
MDGVLPASPLLSSKRHGNEVDSVNTPPYEPVSKIPIKYLWLRVTEIK